MSDETTVVEAPAPAETPTEAPAEDAQVFEERPTVHQELAANVGRAKEARSFERGGEAPEPPPAKAEPGFLPDDAAELDAFLTANPDVREAMIQKPSSEEEVRANLALARESMRGREAVSQMTQAETDAALSHAYEQIVDGDPEDAAAAINALVEQVGLGEEAGEVIRFWSEQDPEASGEWLAAAQGAVAQYQQDGEAQQWQQYAVDVQAWNEQTQTAIKQAVTVFERSHPDAKNYIEAMIGLDQEAQGNVPSLADLVSDPKLLGDRLNLLYEGVRQLDPDAAPERLRDGTWRTSATWEQAEQLKMMNADARPRNEIEVRRLEDRLPEGFFWNRDAKRIEASAPAFDPGQIERNSVTPTTREEWSAAEAKRMSEEVFGQTASVADELHPGLLAKCQPNRLAAVGSADKGPHDRDPDDPGGFWAYTGGFG